MPENAKKPQIRFKGFTDAWEQRKLEKLCSEFKSGESIKNENIKETGSYPVYGGNGLRGYTETYNHNGNFALIGRQGALCGNMNYSSGKAYFTEHAIAVAANAENCTQFLFYLLQLMNLGQYSDQSAQPGLAVNKLTKLETLVPLKKEQKKIRKIFNNLDNLITLHQRKLDKLKNIKKSMLEKMFPKNGSNVPEIRFKGFTDAWEQRKLGCLVTDTIDNRGKNPPYYCESGIPIIDNFMIKNSGYPDLSTATRYIDEFLFEKFIRKYNEVDDTLITLVGNGIGQIALFPKEKSAIIQNTLGLRFSENKIFMYYTLLSKYSVIIKLDRGMAQPSIRQDELKDIDLNIPKIKEQSLIGMFFHKIDNLITLHQRECFLHKEV